MTTVMVVEPDKLLRRRICSLLKQKGFIAEETANGMDAIAHFRTTPIDLVVIELLLPRKDGVSVIHEMKASNPAVKIVAVTDGGRAKRLELLDIAQEAGAYKVLAKPASDADIVEAVMACLQS